MLETVIAIGILAIVIGGAVLYVVRAKKRGVKCIGCPSRGACQGGCAQTKDLIQVDIGLDLPESEGVRPPQRFFSKSS